MKSILFLICLSFYGCSSLEMNQSYNNPFTDNLKDDLRESVVEGFYENDSLKFKNLSPCNF